MTRRTAVRRPRRVTVRFWKQGDSTAFSGHTTNISTTGMFLASNSPAPSGARVRIEVMERERGFVVEGVVVHARKVRPELARISESGMGIRFLTVEDLVGELLPGAGGLHDEVTPGTFSSYAPEAPPPTTPVDRPTLASPFPPAASSAPFPPPAAGGASQSTSSPFPPPAPRPAPYSAPVSDVPASRAAPYSAPVTDIPAPRPAAEAPVPIPSATSSSTPAGGIGTFAVRFATPAEFLEVYRRDILNGGLFVSTRFPARLQETVVVQLHPPLFGAEPISLRARVVQRFEPQAGDLSPNLLSGMGLELVDLPSIVEKMLPVIARMVGEST